MSPSPKRWDLVFNSEGRAFPAVSPLISSPAADASPNYLLARISQLSQKPLLSPLTVCFAPGLYLDFVEFVQRKMNSSFTSEWILLRQRWRRRFFFFFF